MYSNVKSVQLLVAMLKAKKVKNIVVSAGTSHDAIARSLECDDYFKTYNIVDERSAAFFALGLIQELNETVAIVCTAGTAAVNYLTGVTEASRRNLPLVVITADKNPYYYNQFEDQMVDQINLFKSVVKHTVSLPMIKDDKDRWYCERLLNEAFLEINHHGTGPVHINIPIEEGMFAIGDTFTTKELPKIKVIERLDVSSDLNKWEEKFRSLKNKKVLIVYGQDYNVTQSRIEKLEKIFRNYNCLISTEKLSNLHCEGAIEMSKVSRMMTVSGEFEQICPDVVISLAGSVAWDGKFALKSNNKKFENWLVSEFGMVQDFYRNLTNIFECSIDEFLEKMSNYEIDEKNDYYNLCKNLDVKFELPNFEYSNLYVTQKLMNNIPKDSILNLANSSTIRLAQYFDNDPSIKIYCNRGIHGIDGCMSTFIGQSAVTDKLSFLIIGDLTFFYDMNALWNRYVGKNVRIMLVNNSGAALFHFNQGLQKYPTLNENVAADHNATAKGWAESRGFKYLSSTNKEEFDKNLVEFVNPNSDKPIILEVFTKKEDDARLQHEFFEYNLPDSEKLKRNIKSVIKKAIGR